MAGDSDRLLHEHDEKGIDRRQLLKGASLLAGAGVALVPEALGAQAPQGGGQASQGVDTGPRTIQHGWPPYRNTPVKKETIEGFRKHATQDLVDVADRMLGLNVWTGVVRPIAPGMKICGRAVTMRMVPIQNRKEFFTFGSKDFSYTTNIMSWISEPGDILVLDMGGYMEAGLVGGNVAAMSKAMGAGGWVIDGVTRDTNQIMELGEFPVFARGTASPVAHGRFRTANMNNEPVQIGSISVAPGDIVVGDMDGLVVIPADRADEILAMVDKYAAREAEMFRRYNRGEEMVQTAGPLELPTVADKEPIRHHVAATKSIEPSLLKRLPKGAYDPRK